MVKRRHIRVLVPYSRTLYFNDKGRERGISADLVRDFEQYINKKYAKALGKRPVTIYMIPTTRDELLTDVAGGLGDIAVGNLTVTAARCQAARRDLRTRQGRRRRVELYNGWRLYAFQPFAERLAALKKEVERLRTKDPGGYRRHPTTVLLASVHKAITEAVPANPDQPELRVRHSLGPRYAHWRRVKRGLPARYRLFYRFSSKPVRVIVYAWLNDEATLRNAGAKTDVYAVFQRMLARGEVPSDIDALTKGGSEIE